MTSSKYLKWVEKEIMKAMESARESGSIGVEDGVKINNLLDQLAAVILENAEVSVEELEAVNRIHARAMEILTKRYGRG